MSLHLENKILDIIIKNEAEKANEFNEYIAELENFFPSDKIPYHQEAVKKDFEEIKTLFNKLIATNDLQISIELNGELSQKIHLFRIKYSEFISNDILLEAILKQELYYDWKEKIQKVGLILKDVNKIIKSKAQYSMSIQELKNVLSKYLNITEILLETVEKSYLALDLFEINYVRETANELIKFSEDISKELDKINAEFMYIPKSIKTTCKAILWEINKYKPNHLNQSESSWKLVIGEHPYEKLSTESRKRIHLLGED